MAKVFDGGAYLKDRKVNIKFSNGTSADISELSDDAMNAIESLGDEGVKVADIRKITARVIGKEAKDLEGIGVVELRGALDFLTQSLFD